MHFILLFPLITVKISGQNTKSPTRRLSKVEERWQTDQGPWDMRSHTAMSTLGRGRGAVSCFLYILAWVPCKLEMLMSIGKKNISKKNLLSSQRTGKRAVQLKRNLLIIPAYSGSESLPSPKWHHSNGVYFIPSPIAMRCHFILHGAFR